LSYYEDFDFPGSGVTSGGSRPHPERIPQVVALGPNTIDQGLKINPVPFSEKLALVVQSEVRKAFRLDNPCFYTVDKDYLPIFGNEIKRFIVALYGYTISPNPLVPLDNLIDGITNFEFAAILKKIRTATFSRRFKAYSIEEDHLDDFVLPNYREMTDIGDVFNYKYWFRWEEPDPCDFKWSRLPVPEVPDEIKEVWEDALRDVLPDDINEVRKDEILLACTSSSSYNENTYEKSRVFLDKSDPSLNIMSKRALFGKRTLVYKGPTEVRDAVTLSIGQSNTIKWIEKQMADVASRTQFSAYGKSPQEFEKLLKKFYNPLAWYYNRDLTKEGLTKPRWMLHSIAKVCKEKWPDMEIWDYFSIFNNFSLRFEDGKKETFPRGHGLGMANALTTIMQCATHRYNLLCGDLAEDVDALFYNDDATFKGSDEIAIMSLSESEYELLARLGLIIKEKKTYVSRAMVLCERYFPEKFSTKASYSKYIRRLPFAATNIVAAKAMYHMVDDPAFGELEPGLMEEVISFWGYEYHSKESQLPWWAGGWLTARFDKIDLTFCQDWEVSRFMQRGINVGQPQMKPPYLGKKRGVWKHPVLENKWIDPSKILQTGRDVWDIGKDISVMMGKYNRNQHESSAYKWLKLQLCKRYEAWCTPAKPLSFEECYFKVVEDNPYIDFVPPKTCRKDVPLSEIGYCKEERPVPPKQPNKLLGSLSFFSHCSYIPGVIPYPHLPYLGKEQISMERIAKYNESVLALPGVSTIPMIEDATWIANIALYRRDYIDSYGVAEALSTISEKPIYPIPMVRSPIGEVMYQAREYLYLFDSHGDQFWWDIWVQHGRTLVIWLLFNVITPEMLETIIKELEIDPSSEEVKPMIEERKRVIPQKKDLPSLFWTWRSGMELDTYVPEAIKKIWREVSGLINQADTFKRLSLMSSTRRVNPLIKEGMPEENSMYDRLAKDVTGVQGILYEGYYIYTVPDMSDAIWGSDSEDFGLGLPSEPG